MSLTYIYHSGFVIETDRCIVVMDYYKDPADAMPRFLDTGKRMYVLSSHFHPDHFNPDIFNWRKRHADTLYILSKDILRHRRARREDATAWLTKGSMFEDGFIRVKAYGSTDSGVSFLIDIDGKRIFHAGDLNNWHWTDESTAEEAAKAEAMYLGELKDMRKDVSRLDIAFFPVDARIGSGYMRGAEQFVDMIHTSLFVPMHFTANGVGSANAFAPFVESKGGMMWTIKKEGESMATSDFGI